MEKWIFVFEVIIAVFWKKCHSEISSFLCFGACNCLLPGNSNMCMHTCGHTFTCAHTHTACFIDWPFTSPSAHWMDIWTVKYHPHNSATFTVGFYQYFLPMGPGASHETSLASSQTLLLSDSDSNTIQFPDHGKRFPLNFFINLEL